MSEDGKQNGERFSGVKALAFDLDGTLIDSKLDLAHAANAARGHMGMPPIGNERVYSYVGNGAPVLMRRVLGAEATAMLQRFFQARR